MRDCRVPVPAHFCLSSHLFTPSHSIHMKTNLNLHLVLSIFFLPLMLMYAITGAMYMAGTDGQLGSETMAYELKAAQASPEALAELQRLGVELPEGELRPGKGGKVMLGNGASRHISFSTGRDGTLRAEVVEPGLYPSLMLIHKGKAGMWFTVLGYGAAACMLLLYVTGIVILWKSRRKRVLMLASFGLGCVAVWLGFLTL